MTDTKLSILIPTLYRRKELLDRLLGLLHAQLGTPGETINLLVGGGQRITKQLLNNGQIELIINSDEGRKTIGQKRNELVEAATGQYVIFIDDDDIISDDYISEIFKGIETNADHIGISAWIIPDNGPKALVRYSKHYSIHYQHPEGQEFGTHYRPAMHLCAIKRNIAFSCRFPLSSFGEDTAWGFLVCPLIKSEYLINTPIYTYLFRSNKTV